MSFDALLVPDIIRECYKFICAPTLGDNFDSSLHIRQREQINLEQLR